MFGTLIYNIELYDELNKTQVNFKILYLRINVELNTIGFWDT